MPNPGEACRAESPHFRRIGDLAACAHRPAARICLKQDVNSINAAFEPIGCKGGNWPGRLAALKHLCGCFQRLLGWTAQRAGRSGVGAPGIVTSVVADPRGDRPPGPAGSIRPQ
jgi:hypothetical protein